MNKTIILEIPHEVFSSFQKQAEGKCETAEKFVLEIVLKKFSKMKGNLSKQEKDQALVELMKFAGAGNKF